MTQEELKTLSNFTTLSWKGGTFFGVKMEGDDFVSVKELRQEAIKHARRIREINVTYETEPIIAWIKRFFNLTEEELK